MPEYGENFFISENALSPNIASDNNEQIFIDQTNLIYKELIKMNSKEDVISFIQNYFDNYQMVSQKQHFGKDGKIFLIF